MLGRKVLHTLYGAIFAIFIVVLVDLQLRTRTAQRYEGSLGDVFVRRPMIKDLNTSRERPPSVIGRRSEYSKAAEAINHILSDRKVLRRNTDKLILKRQPPTVAPLQLADIFIAVKTTSRFHVTRLALLLQTWISRTKGHTYIFTDNLDEDGVLKGFNVISTSCSPEHSHQALSCKMSVEYESFMASKKKWLCHVDDDNYVNPRALLTLLSTFPQDSDVYVGKPSLDRPMRTQELLENNKTRQVEFWFATGGAGFCLSRRLAEKMAPWASSPRFEQTSAAIRLPDDCTVGFIVERRLGIPLVHSSMFHSHLENLQLLTPHDILLQVTLSYGLFENQMNSVELKGVFSQEDDPSRFKTVHCLLYPLTNWCP